MAAPAENLDEPGDSAEAKPTLSRRRGPSSALFVWSVAFGFMGAALGVGLALYLMREPAPPLLTEALLQTAVERWEEKGPASYIIQIEVTTDRVSNYRIMVKSGALESMTIDGHPVMRKAASSGALQ